MAGYYEMLIVYEKDLKGRVETFGMERKKLLKKKKFFTLCFKKRKSKIG